MGMHLIQCIITFDNMNQKTVLINPFLFSQTLIKLWEQVNYEETLFSTACPVSMPTVK